MSWLLGARSIPASPIGTVVAGQDCTPIDNGELLGTVVDPGAEFFHELLRAVDGRRHYFDSIILTMLLLDAVLSAGGTTLTISNLGWKNHPSAVITGFDDFSTN